MSATLQLSPVSAATNRYFAFVQWSDEDVCYVGYCPDLFPYGGVCHDEDPVRAYAELRRLMEEEVADLIAEGRPLPPIKNPIPAAA